MIKKNTKNSTNFFSQLEGGSLSWPIKSAGSGSLFINVAVCYVETWNFRCLSSFTIGGATDDHTFPKKKKHAFFKSFEIVPKNL